jgi:hypothetical protein
VTAVLVVLDALLDAYKCTMFWKRIGLSKSSSNSNSSSMEVDDLPSRATPKEIAAYLKFGRCRITSPDLKPRT